MTTYTSPYTGQTISPSQVGYESLTISTSTTLQWPINGNTSSVVANIIEVIATVGSLNLLMPSATEVSVGQTTLIKNNGSNSFTVTDNSGNTIVTIAAGLAWYIYLTDNSTVNGTWSTVQFGAGSSQANAASLDGYGLTAVNTTLNTTTTVSTFSSNYTLIGVDQSSMYVWTGGAGTLTLPTASIGAGWYVVVKNNGTGVLTIAPAGTNTIDGASNAQLQIGESLVVTSSGSNWYSYAYGRSNLFFFTQLVLSVTGGTTTLTSAQAANTVQEYIGVLTSNQIIILPSTVQLYTIQNNTTGAYTLTFKTTSIGASTVVVPSGGTIIAICDGTNVYNSQTSTSTFTTATLNSGSAAVPSLNFTSSTGTGLYLAASNQLGFATNGVNVGIFNAAGLLFVPAGIPGGTF